MTLKDFIKEQKNHLMNNKEKIETKDIVDREITLDDFEIMSGSNGESYAVVTLKEFPDKFIFAGKVLTDNIIKMYNEFGDALHAMMSDEDIKIRLTTKKAKSGKKNSYTDVEFLNLD